MRALINAFIIHVTLNILVFLKGWHAFDEKKWARILLSVVFLPGYSRPCHPVYPGHGYQLDALSVLCRWIMAYH